MSSDEAAITVALDPTSSLNPGKVV